MRKDFAALLRERVILLDGGMGSALIARGLESGSCPELWNLERPRDVAEIHAAFVRAGSDVVQTNTFGGHPSLLDRHGLGERTEEIHRAAARIAREAAGEECLVAGNLGPSGLLLPPVGDADPDLLEEGFARQVAALEEGGVDYVSVETMMDLREALCAVRAARRAGRLPVTACMTFDRKKRGFFTMMGDEPGECMRALADEGAIAVGANCSLGSEAMIELCPRLVADAPVPVIVKPNAGLPETEAGRPVYRQDPHDFARDGAALVRHGASAVGGCCGTDGRFIAALKTALESAAQSGSARDADSSERGVAPDRPGACGGVAGPGGDGA